MNFIIATDSTCDLPKEILHKLEVEQCDMLYYVDDAEYGKNDTNQMEFKQFYDCMRNGSKTSTSMINEDTARTFLLSLLGQGKDVLYLSFASALSGTYENFKRVAEELNATNEHKVYVVDSKSAASGEGLFVTLVAQKRNGGASFEETCKYADEIRDRVLHYFIVEDLKYLARGGRLSKGSAFFGNMLNIKPVLHVDEQGRLIPIKKVIGRKKSVNMLIEKLLERYNKESDTIYISHGDCFEEAQYLAEQVNEKLGITPTVMPLGYVIGSHSGPGTLTVFFTGDTRKES